jgi:hypothetical protein
MLNDYIIYPPVLGNILYPDNEEAIDSSGHSFSLVMCPLFSTSNSTFYEKYKDPGY